MRRIGSLFLLVTLLPFALRSQVITMEDVFVKRKFFPANPDAFIPMKKGTHYCVLESASSIAVYNYVDGEKVSILADVASLTPAGSDTPLDIEELSLSVDESKLLIKTNSEPLYRHSEISEYWVVDLKAKNCIPVSRGGKQRLAELSPDGKIVAFVRDNNLFMKDLGNDTETQITSDGSWGKIINGATDWVYEEEFGINKAFFWSSDSKHLAYLRFDESKVKEYNLSMYNDSLYPQSFIYKYPKAGEDNSLVTVWMYNCTIGNSAKPYSVDIGIETDQYIPRLIWTADAGKLAVLRLNRLQNKLEILLADTATGSSEMIYTEENKWYIEITDYVYFLDDNKHFMIFTERDEYQHLYMFDMEGNLVNLVTPGNNDVIEIMGIDQKNKMVYYTAAESSPINRELFSVRFNGTDKKKLSATEGSNRADFNSDFTYYVAKWSDANTPPRVTVNSINGKEVRLLEDNAQLRQKMKEYSFANREFFSFKTEDGSELYGWIMKPPDFDPSKKYPVLMDVYGGPNSQTVINAWSTMFTPWYQIFLSKGYIVASVDGRGTGARGEMFRKCTYLNMGKYETEDLIEGAKYLGKQSYVDNKRIGIWGWSYGGFLSALCLTKGADYFKAGVAVAPITNWKYYDNIYTERFMRTPAENPAGYDDNSPIRYAKNLKGKLLIVHGMADDNVHMQNTLELANAFVKADKQFDLMLYPDRNHGIYGGNTRMHLFRMITDYILENL